MPHMRLHGDSGGVYINDYISSRSLLETSSKHN